MCARHQKDQLLGGRKKEGGMTNWQSKRGCFRGEGIFHKMERALARGIGGRPRGSAGQVQTRKWASRRNWRCTLQEVWKEAGWWSWGKGWVGKSSPWEAKQEGFFKGKPCLMNLSTGRHSLGFHELCSGIPRQRIVRKRISFGIGGSSFLHKEDVVSWQGQS